MSNNLWAFPKTCLKNCDKNTGVTWGHHGLYTSGYNSSPTQIKLVFWKVSPTEAQINMMLAEFVRHTSHSFTKGRLVACHHRSCCKPQECPQHGLSKKHKWTREKGANELVYTYVLFALQLGLVLFLFGSWWAALFGSGWFTCHFVPYLWFSGKSSEDSPLGRIPKWSTTLLIAGRCWKSRCMQDCVFFFFDRMLLILLMSISGWIAKPLLIHFKKSLFFCNTQMSCIRL